MRYMSDKTNKCYDSVEECIAAEEQWEKENAEKIALAEKRKARAEEVAKAREEIFKVKARAQKKIEEAQHKYDELVSKFIEDFGVYHVSYSSSSNERGVNLVEDFFREVAKIFEEEEN